MIPAAFEYVRPRSVEDALDALSQSDARVLAGGQSLLPMMKLRLARPSRLVDIKSLELGALRSTGDVVEIGARVTYDALLRDVRPELPDALREAVASVGDLQVRNCGTLAGAIAHADPASDVAAAFLALDGTAHIASRTGTREVSSSEFFTGVYTTAVEPGELLTAISISAAREGDGSAYVAFDDPASGYPLAGAAALVRTAGPKVAACAVGLTGVGATPLRATSLETEVVATSEVPQPERIAEHLAQLPLLTDDYRANLATHAVKRALTTAFARALRDDARR